MSIDVRGLEVIVGRLKSSAKAVVEVLPHLLTATMDESGGVAVCEAHKAFLVGEDVGDLRWRDEAGTRVAQGMAEGLAGVGGRREAGDEPLGL